jgi:Flp pilus assembly protein TadG
MFESSIAGRFAFCANLGLTQMLMIKFSSRLRSLLHSFAKNSRGNVAVIFTLAMIPILIAVGCAIDYTMATKIRVKLQAAADAASVAALATKSPGYVVGAAMLTDGPIPVGVTDAIKVFYGNLSRMSSNSNSETTSNTESNSGYTLTSVTATVTRTGIVLNSSVQFSATVPSTFLNIIGLNTVAVSGSSSSTVSLPLYLDFYLMLDVSGSMGLPSTNAEQTRLAAINPDMYSDYPNGCTYACHFTDQNACGGGQKYNTDGYCLGYALSRNAGNSANTPVTACLTDGTSACIQLRADAVGYAVTQLLATANASQKIANQFRIGLYPFIQNLYAYYPLTSSISGSTSNPGTINYAAANLASLLDTGVNRTLGSGGTHFENAFPTMNGLIASAGDGSTANNTAPFLFLVTDGAQNNQYQWNYSWWGSNHATTFDPSFCTTMKNRGVRVAVLLIPYQPIQDPTSFASGEDFAANDNIPAIEPVMRNCASPNFFYTANTPADITAMLNKMFGQALNSAHITN